MTINMAHMRVQLLRELVEFTEKRLENPNGWSNALTYENFWLRARADLPALLDHVEKQTMELETAKAICKTAQDVARAAWGGEIPSPLPGHKAMTEEELLAEEERRNCPWCGGSGHVDDCDEADKKVKAQLAKLSAGAAAMITALQTARRALVRADGMLSYLYHRKGIDIVQPALREAATAEKMVRATLATVTAGESDEK